MLIRDNDSDNCEKHDDHAETEDAAKGKLLRPRESDPHSQIKGECYDHCVGNEVYRCAKSERNQTARYMYLALTLT